jgi:hypothetical protein
VGEHLGAEVVAVGQLAVHRFVAVATGPDLVHLAVGKQEHLVGLVPELDDDVAGGVLVLREPVRQRGQHLDVVVVAQQRQLAELLWDHADVRAAGGEGNPAVADGVAQPAVDPVHTAGDLYPRQHFQQPP